MQLCWLLAALLGMERHSRESIVIYSERPTFSGRSEALEKAIEKFTIAKHDQEMDAALYGALASSRQFSQQRNNIVHAHVVIFQYTQSGARPVFKWTPDFCLVPAYYDRKRVDENIVPEYLYLAEDIDKLSSGFIAFANEVEGLTEWVYSGQR